MKHTEAIFEYLNRQYIEFRPKKDDLRQISSKKFAVLIFKQFKNKINKAFMIEF